MVRFLNVYTISAFVSIGVALIGFDISSMSGVLGTHQYQDFYRNPLGIRQGLITSAMAAGSIVGALSAGALGNKFSRKVTIQGGSVLWCIGSTVQSTSNGVPMLISGRVISGLCIGIMATLTPTYQSEIAPRKIRGRVVSFQSLAGTLGIMIQYFIQYGCSFIGSEAAFRVPWAIQAVPAIVLFVGLFWLPYSPRWLASKDRWDEVLTVLAFLRTVNNNVNDPLVLAEYKEIEDQIRFEREVRFQPIRELLSRKMRKRVFLGMAVQIWSQLTGMNVMMYYIVYILQSAGITSVLLASSIQYVINVVMTIPAILWMDRYGRRPALLLGALSMALWLYLIGGLLMAFGEPNPVPNQPSTWIIIDHPNASRTILACSYLVVGTFAVTWAPVSWIYQAEVVPLRIRVRSVSLSTASNWVFNFMLALGVPPLLRSISWRMFFIFASLNVLAFIHIWVAAPETKQRTLEEIDEIFEHGGPLWKSFTGKLGTSRLEQLAKDIETGKVKVRQGG
ncbi:general substrate transporter [Lipomyces tetrasporus]|uniref:General substrate transporter n=1 Tax=Lipomyces tetrasporus TaxID=54092 RepID=A0AAD7QPN6_9ASCO|nr:general substrate transporter [Lipomyces tetrasporus]KAJ8099018.1 general substrate transporter [Lipomyces tetrasporus]